MFTELKRIRWLNVNELFVVSVNLLLIFFISLFFIIINDFVVVSFLKQLELLLS